MSQSRRRKSPTILLLVLVAAAAAALAWLVVPRLTGASSGSAASGQPSGTPGAASAVATESIPPPYTIKPEPTFVARDKPRPTTASGATAAVSLTYVTFDTASGTVQASGFVAGLIENGGTCTLTLTKGADVVTATSTGAADATTTSCGLLQTRRGLAAGTWTAVLSYSSPRATGRSTSTEVTVR